MNPRDVSTWSGQACRESGAYRIGNDYEHEWDGVGFPLQRRSHRSGSGEDHVRVFDQLFLGGIASEIDPTDIFQRPAAYVDRVKGAKPSDLPVQAPVKFRLVINLETAMALWMNILPSLLSATE
jgi:hypothetical protein